MRGVYILLLLLLVPIVSASHFGGNMVDIQIFTQIPDPVQPGNYVDLRLRIQNFGGNTLEDFEVQVVPQYPFKVVDGYQFYGALGGGNRGNDAVITKFRLAIDKNALEGENIVKIRYRWKDSDWLIKELIINVETEAILYVKEIKTIPERITPGEQFILNITLENQADSFIKNVDITLAINDPFVTIGSTNEKSIRTIDAGEEVTVSYSLISQGNTDKIVYTIPLEIEYLDNEGNIGTKNVSFGLILLDKPQFIKNIDSTDIITSGTKGKISVSLSNIGVEEIKFVKLEILNTEDYKVVSARELYLGNIDSDDFETGTYELYVDTKKKEVPIQFTLTYKDALNKEFVENMTLSLPLYSKGEASKLGLIKGNNFFASYIGFVILVFLFIFWVEMLMSLLKKKMIRYKKILWIIILFTTTIFGATAYYFFVKRHNA